MRASPPTDEQRGCVRMMAGGQGRPPLRSVYRGCRHIMSLPPSTLRVATSLTEGGFERPPRRGRLDATALPWHTGRCGHRPLRTVSRSAVLWADRVVRPYGRATGCERETGGGISQGHSFRFAPQRRTLPLRTYSSAVLPLLCGGGFSCQESKMRATKTGADVV